MISSTRIKEAADEDDFWDVDTEDSPENSSLESGEVVPHPAVSRSVGEEPSTRNTLLRSLSVKKIKTLGSKSGSKKKSKKTKSRLPFPGIPFHDLCLLDTETVDSLSPKGKRKKKTKKKKTKKKKKKKKHPSPLVGTPYRFEEEDGNKSGVPITAPIRRFMAARSRPKGGRGLDDFGAQSVPRTSPRNNEEVEVNPARHSFGHKRSVSFRKPSIACAQPSIKEESPRSILKKRSMSARGLSSPNL